jgi:hypothetical protein
MLAKCWLHIGVEKTGTTSIQSFLATNRTALRAEGRLYPATPGPVSHLDLVAFALDDDRIDGTRKAHGLTTPSRIAAFRDDFVRALVTEIASGGVSEIILSSELLSSRIRSPSELARIKILCAGIARNTKIVVYLRNQVDFLVSRYTTVIQAGSSEEFRARAAPLADYAVLLDRWGAAFGRENLVIRRFEPADFVDGDLLADFAATIGLESTKLVSVPHFNESLDAESLAFLRAINRRLPRRLSDRLGPMRSAAVTVLQRRHGGTKFVISPALASQIEARFRSSNEKVSAEYFGSRYQPLFSAPALVGRSDESAVKSIGFLTSLRIAGFLALGLVREFLGRRVFRNTAVPDTVPNLIEES